MFEYRNKGTEQYKQLTPNEKHIIDGVHQRSGYHSLLLPNKPSIADYAVLNKAYDRQRVLKLHVYAWCNPEQVHFT